MKENALIKVKDLSVSSPVRFSQFGSGRERYWTLDGPMLNDFRIYADIRPGENLFLSPKGYAERRGEGSLYRKGMEAIEIQELFVDALQGVGIADVSAENLRPAKFGAREGFRFELKFKSPGVGGGLQYQATVLAEVEGNTLSYLYFDAPAEYFFQRDIGHIEQIFASLSAAK
ncbi:hypothetical protein HC761_01405 [bacterium]|nr:hypothetical protein [bacterium]